MRQPSLSQSQTWTRSSSLPTPARSTTWTRSSTTWTRRAAAVVAGALGTMAVGAGVATAAEPAPTQQYVVRALPGQLPAVHRDLLGRGAVVRQIRLISADVVRLSATQAAAVAADPRVASVTRDRSVRLAGAPVKDTTPGTESLAEVAEAIGADALQRNGITGAGVDVALIDSGVAPVGGLTGDHVVHGPDLSFDSQVPGLAHLDAYGHGTHLAGIIAGRGTVTGIAPDARLVSVKVADSHGNSDVSQVIAGIDWVVQHRHTGGLDIRVLNLAFGTDSDQAYQLDPLAFAAEQAWHAGIVVVVSAGNDGTAHDHLSDPAVDPYVLAVGAADTTRRFPTVAPFSARGDGVRNPDLVAPGVKIASLRDAGSFLDQEHPNARQGDGLFRGSGTSQAAAVTSGAAALLLSARPDLTPDQVKALLQRTADRLPSYKARSQGAGVLDLVEAVAAPAPSAVQSYARSTGTGSLEASRGSFHLGKGKDALVGEQDVFGRPFDTATMAAAAAGHRAWNGGVFNGQAWAGSGFDGQAWGSAAWATTAWTGQSWQGQAWLGQAWQGQAWSGQAWNGQAWSGQAWQGQAWQGQSWQGQSWQGQSWQGQSWQGQAWE